MSLYDKYILPNFLNCICSAKPIGYQRQKIVPYAEGAVLEVGIGSGLNLPFYDKSRVDKIWGLDPSKELNKMASKVASEEGLEVDFLISEAEDIPLPDNEVDTVLITYTMCTITEVIRANEEMRRVLKPKGKMIFCEHGKSPDQNVFKWQKRINPLWRKIAGGCNLHRDIPSLIKESGFKLEKLDTMYLPSTPKFAGYNYWGYAKPII
tara:strand:- start:475 stop:1098 length:624 start_codon:yes stop_codon:yes gene_type:complete